MWNCLTAKHYRYANEREVRFILMNVREKFDEHRRTQGSSGRTYVEASMSFAEPGNIAEVLVGQLCACCARAAIGHAATAPPRRVMNSRRLIRLNRVCFPNSRAVMAGTNTKLIVPSWHVAARGPHVQVSATQF